MSDHSPPPAPLQQQHNVPSVDTRIPLHIAPPAWHEPATTTRFPAPYEILPASVQSLADCAAHQIQSLHEHPEQTKAWEDAVDNGFMICDLNVVYNKLCAWRALFPPIKPFFALKCHPDPMVATVLKLVSNEEDSAAAVGFDCASIAEIQLALSGGGIRDAARHVVYANPQRAEPDIDTALSLDVRAFTFDGPEELRKIHRAYQRYRLQWFHDLKSRGESEANAASPPPPPDLILRIVVPDEHSTVPLGEKFGAPPHRVAELTQLAVSLQLPVIGVSFHCGSGNHDPTAYGAALQLAAQAMQIIDQVQVGRCCWLLDIGGGYPGRDGVGGDVFRFVGPAAGLEKANEEGETAAGISQVVLPLLNQLYPSRNSVQVIAEPGRYFVEASFMAVCRIYRCREEDDGPVRRRHYYIAYGVQGLFKDCVLCNESFVPIPLKMANLQQRDKENGAALENTQACLDDSGIHSTIHGPSGEDYDVLCQDCLLPFLQVDDWLLFDRMGAYTVSIAGRNGRPPVRYVVGSGQGVTTGL
jgi:ornithine decarboxylase